MSCIFNTYSEDSICKFVVCKSTIYNNENNNFTVCKQRLQTVSQSKSRQSAIFANLICKSMFHGFQSNLEMRLFDQFANYPPLPYYSPSKFSNHEIPKFLIFHSSPPLFLKISDSQTLKSNANRSIFLISTRL